MKFYTSFELFGIIEKNVLLHFLCINPLISTLMHPHNHYVPALKAKRGEFEALERLDSALKKQITPLFEVQAVDWDYEKNVEKHSIDRHLTGFGEKILKSWGEPNRFFVDSAIHPSRLMGDEVTHHLAFIFAQFRDSQLQAVPVTSIEKSDVYKQAVRKIANEDRRGICLRLGLNEANRLGKSFGEAIKAEVEAYELPPTEIDVIVDLKSISGITPNILELAVSDLIDNRIPYCDDWRSVTFLSSAFPKDLSGVPANNTKSIERSDWKLWLSTRASFQRPLFFGDYAITHPEGVEMDPRFMNPAAAIRYTHLEKWVIVKGASLRTHTYSQYHKLCQNLVSMSEFLGKEFSWGDKFIDVCSNPNSPTGNATTWRAVATNHHLQMVVDQLSNLPVP